MNILDEIAEYSRERLKVSRHKISDDAVMRGALSLPKGNFAFEAALRREGLSFICECKKASPSKGVIAQDFPYVEIAREYEAAGADAVSVLTEPKYFLGHDDYLREISGAVKIPVLRKDFVVHERMIYEAKLLGASAVLLICAILGGEKLSGYIQICNTLGLSALVEAHDEAEIESAITAGATIIGVNNRNLKDFSVDMANTSRLHKLIPHGVIFVSESGIKSAQDVKAARDSGADAVLVGETLMRSDDKRAMMKQLRSLL